MKAFALVCALVALVAAQPPPPPPFNCMHSFEVRLSPHAIPVVRLARRTAELDALVSFHFPPYIDAHALRACMGMHCSWALDQLASEEMVKCVVLPNVTRMARMASLLWRACALLGWLSVVRRSGWRSVHG
jgi:hypothetical protein